VAVAPDASGNLAVADNGGHLQFFKAPLSGASTSAAAFNNGAASNNGQLAFMSTGDLWAATVSNRANRFNSPFSNSSTPAAFVTDPTLVSTIGAAFDAQQNLYLSNAGTGNAAFCGANPPGCSSGLLVYAPPYTGAPIITPNVAGPFPGAKTAYRKIAVNATRLYAASVADPPGRVDVYNMPITAASVPAFSLTSGVNTPEGLTLDAAGNLYIGNLSDATVTVYTAPITASSVPSLIYKVSTGAFAIFGIAVGNASVTPTACTDLPSLGTPHNTGLAVALNCSDPDPLDTFTYSVVSGPLHGTLSAPNATGHLTYTPAAEYAGPDSFTYKATDNHGISSNTATVGITVGASPPPSCANRSLSVARNKPKSLNLGCSHAQPAHTLHWKIVSAPRHGKLSAIDQDGNVSYTPSRNYGGADNFKFNATDTTTGITSNTAATAITVAGNQCSELKGEKLARCMAALKRDNALTACGRLKGKNKHNACIAAAKLAYRRAIALAHCQTLKGTKKTACVRAAQKLK
jgi:hypothetical protein